MTRSVAVSALIVVFIGVMAQVLAPPADAVPAPEVEYTHDVVVRRHFDFPNNDAIGYGYHVCDDVARGQRYGDILRDVKDEVRPNDEQSANYVVSYAVGLLCPNMLWQLRNSAAGYVAPPS